MAYEKQEWKDFAEGGMLVTAERLNHMEEGIGAVDDWAEYTSDGKLRLRGFNGIELNTDDDSDVKVESLLVSGNAAATQNVISDKYNSATTYNAGDLLIYDNQLYRVKMTCQGITPPNVTYYEATNLQTQLKNIYRVKRTMSTSVTVAANEYSIVIIPINVPTGYKMVGINSLTFTGNARGDIVSLGYVISNGNKTITLHLRNLSSSSYTFQCDMYINYVNEANWALL